MFSTRLFSLPPPSLQHQQTQIFFFLSFSINVIRSTGQCPTSKLLIMVYPTLPPPATNIRGNFYLYLLSTWLIQSLQDLEQVWVAYIDNDHMNRVGLELDPFRLTMILQFLTVPSTQLLSISSVILLPTICYFNTNFNPIKLENNKMPTVCMHTYLQNLQNNFTKSVTLYYI
jgi:hypothetical protein